jgi:asparagine synthetase B (glutamine-hydrolysing)
MFLFCVTRGSVAHRIDAPAVREVAAGDWRVTVASDGWLSSAEVDASRAAVREAAPYDRRLLFAGAGYRRDSDVIEIEKSLVGGRQVYYHVAADGSFYCASHARLLRMAGVPLRDDPGRLAELFVYRYVSPPRTLFRGVSQLLAGERLRFELRDGAWRQTGRELYAPPAPPPPATRDDSYGVHGDRARDALRGAMLDLAPARGSLHVLASGGLDSSILFKLARDELGVRHSYSTSYPFEVAEEDVEKQYALTAAEALGAEHHFFAPTTPQFVRGLLDAVSIAEEPVVHTQSVLMLLLLRGGLPGGEGTVVVGQGADGAFGLRMHHTVERVDRFRRSRPRVAVALGGLAAAVNPALDLPGAAHVVRRTLSRLRRDNSVVNVLPYRWGPGVPPPHRRNVLRQLGAAGYERWARRRFGATPEEVFDSRAAAIAPYAGRPVLDQISLLDFLSDVTVTQSIWSKFGESARKVVYYPFNAPRLLDAALAAPWELKLKEPKGVLRDVARKVGLPEFIITRRKANFNADPSRWAVPGAVLDPLVPLAAKVFGWREVRRMQRPRSRGAYTFWTMLNYAIWKRLFIDGETVGSLLADLQAPLPDDGPSGELELAAGN